MPRIHDALLDAVTFVDVELPHGKTGGATGFFVDLRFRAVPQTVFRYVVTNSHVINNAVRTTVRVNTHDGRRDALVIPSGAWHSHPQGDDLAAAAVTATDPGWRIQGLDWNDAAPRPERIKELNMGVGDDVIMVGRFVGHTGKENDQPVARFGNIAMMPGKVLDGRGLTVEAYLVEMRSLSGFSGSPVFVYMGPGTYRGEIKKDDAVL